MLLEAHAGRVLFGVQRAADEENRSARQQGPGEDRVAAGTDTLLGLIGLRHVFSLQRARRVSVPWDIMKRRTRWVIRAGTRTF
ncbi:MAG: hypothetical protein LC808_41350 [Actinobacteria bacterium]|nr:hypothetical protein [Actinomycetota bacterium]